MNRRRMRSPMSDADKRRGHGGRRGTTPPHQPLVLLDGPLIPCPEERPVCPRPALSRRRREEYAAGGSRVPKIVDHKERRKHIAKAVWAIVSSRGFEAITLRAVAAEARVSMMMEQSNDPTAPRTIIRAIVHQTIPLTAEQRADSAVWMAFVTRATVDDQLRDFIRRTWSDLHDFISSQITTAQKADLVPRNLDAGLEAANLVAMTDGLAAHLLVGQYSNETAIEVVEHRLDQLFAH